MTMLDDLLLELDRRDHLRASLASAAIPCLDPAPQAARCIAAEMTGRDCHAIEIAPAYVAPGASLGSRIERFLSKQSPGSLGVGYNTGEVKSQPESDTDRETRIRRSPNSWVANSDMSFVLARLDEARASSSELESKLQYARAVGEAALSALHKAELSAPSSIDLDAWLTARTAEQFRQQAPSNNWIERLHSDYYSLL